ncbi:GNAT family N-acetyltransferase [Paenibacillus turpanensis]|uniref:GNAT family N-acetyltransferase n=1 Tax=Paenibacillus turpanensis TaxID=2689078 RepID=UPI00140CEFDF|nr:GNAT family N-acetyltransferase [Paenibacillus turpanensis]
MIELFELNDKKKSLDELTAYVWSKWGTTSNFSFYQDCMLHSLTKSSDVPKFYFAADGEKVVGCFALLRSELVSRQDLTPWFACLFVEEEYRGHSLGAKFLQYAAEEAKKFGYEKLYLSTSLENYYEKYNWEYMADCNYFNGEKTKVYGKEL